MKASAYLVENDSEDASVRGSQHPDRVASGIPARTAMAKHEDHAFHLSRQYPDIAHPDLAHAEHRWGIDHDVSKSVAEGRHEVGESLRGQEVGWIERHIASRQYIKSRDSPPDSLLESFPLPGRCDRIV